MRNYKHIKNIFPHPSSSTSSPQVVQGSGGCSQPITLHPCHSFTVTLCFYSRVGSLQTDPAWASCSSSSTAPTWLQLYSVGPILQNCTVPLWAALHRLLLHSGASPRGVPVGCGSFRPPSSTACGLLHGCMQRFAPYGVHGLQGDSLVYHRPV